MGDAEMPSVFSDTVRKARREHRCCECRQTIKVGENYHLFKGCWDGKWGHYKTCMDCQDLREEVGGLYRSDDCTKEGSKMKNEPWLSEPEIWKEFCAEQSFDVEWNIKANFNLRGSTENYYLWFSKGWRAAREGEEG